MPAGPGPETEGLVLDGYEPPAPGFVLAASSAEISAADAADLRARFRAALPAAPGRLAAPRPGGHGMLCGCQPCQVRQILAVLTEPVGLADGDLPPYGVPDPGCCTACLRGPLYKGRDVCLYCHSLAELARSGQAVPGERHHDPAPGHVPCTCILCRDDRWRRRMQCMLVIVLVLLVSWAGIIAIAYALGGGS